MATNPILIDYPITPRRARMDDAAAIARVNVQSWREAYGNGLMPAAMMAALSVARSTERWALAFNDPATAAHTFVVEAEGAVVGYAIGGQQRSTSLAAASFEGEVMALYVLAAWHRRNIATALVEACAGHLATLGLSGFAVWSLRDNAPARAFYERIGGHVVGEREDRRDTDVLHEIAYGWTADAVRRLSTINGE